MTQPAASVPYKQLRRPTSDRIVAGVASGLGRYFNVDPTVVRVAFAVLAVVTWGWALLAYPVMWFLIPEEPGPAQAWPQQPPAPAWSQPYPPAPQAQPQHYPPAPQAQAAEPQAPHSQAPRASTAQPVEQQQAPQPTASATVPDDSPAQP